VASPGDIGSSRVDGSSPVAGSSTTRSSTPAGSSPPAASSPASNPSPETGSSPGTAPVAPADPAAPIANLTVDELPGEGLFIGNAGVILTHPFLNHLFKLTGLVANGRFIDEQHRQKAIHLIHYLATGSTTAEEHELAIAKILCACPLEEPMEKQLVWTPEELQHADALLEGLISHWGVKGITPEGLRGNFLTRNGKIYTRSEKIYLTIEQHAVDILIRTYALPWNMSFIKLPWFSQAIHLDW
jgi:hypothetical protein